MRYIAYYRFLCFYCYVVQIQNPLPFQSASSDLEITTIADVIGVYDYLWWGKSFQDPLCKEALLVGSPQWKRRDFKKENDSC